MSRSDAPHALSLSALACLVGCMYAPDFDVNPSQAAQTSGTGSSGESSSSSTGSSSSGGTGSSSSGDESSGEPGSTTGGERGESSSEGASTGSSTGPAVVCGDGVVEGDEQCEGEESCHACHVQRHVFVSSAVYEGSELDGLDHADQLCQQLAASNPDLPNPSKFRAWLSDSFTDAGDRVGLDLAGRYTLPDDLTVVAETGEDFLTASLSGFGIDHDEHMNLVAGNVWTGTGPGGMRIASSSHCINWTTSDPMQLGYYGRVGAADASWTLSDSMTNPNVCLLNLHIYCIEGQ